MTNVQGLMGNHLRDLKVFENDTVIQSWLNTRLQSDLDTLGLGLTTNRTDPATAPSNAVTPPQGKNTYLLCVLSDSRFYAHTLVYCISSNSKLLALSGMGKLEIVATLQLTDN